MKTDNLFYYIFLNYPQIFFELIEKPDTNVNDYEFTSREVKQRSFRLDGLFLPINKALKQPFYVVEVQFQPDHDFYYRLFSEFLLYLRQYQPPLPWQIVVIYPSRHIEIKADIHFKSFLALEEVKVIYLDELKADTLGLKTVKLFIEKEDIAVEKAKSLISQAQSELKEVAIQKEFIDLIETIIVYKLPKKSREEIEAMLGLNSIKETKVYQEAFDEGVQIGKLEGKLDAITTMNNLGLSLEIIAQSLNLPLDYVRQIVNKNK